MGTEQTIYIGSDHGGFELKESLCAYLTEEGFTVRDKGTISMERCDYPDFIFSVAESVAQDPKSRGVVICTTGIGASICANKVKGIRAALCLNEDQAIMSRRHNDANVLVFGSKYVSPEDARALFTAWIDEDFEGGRHAHRLEKIHRYEENGST